jgi:hypothetical protein
VLEVDRKINFIHASYMNNLATLKPSDINFMNGNLLQIRHGCPLRRSGIFTKVSAEVNWKLDVFL